MQAYHQTMIKNYLLKVIPRDPEVVVSVQNTLVWNYFMQRKITLIFPGGALEKTIGVNLSNLSWTGFLKYTLVLVFIHHSASLLPGREPELL